jgi:hypothetical protein
MGLATRDGLVHADDVDENSINYAYASWLGTGYYRIDDQSIYLLRGPFSHTLREADGEDWGLKLLFPATLGFEDFNRGYDDVGLITLIPGLSLIYPVKENWWLKPFLQAGIGKDLSGGDASFIWGMGAKSLATFPYRGIEIDLGNSLMIADNSRSGEQVDDDGFSMWERGLNLRKPVDFRVRNRETYLNVFFVYTGFLNRLEFTQDFADDTKVRRLYKVGVALGGKDAFSMWGLGFSGLGIDYTFGPGFSGFGLTTGFPF